MGRPRAVTATRGPTVRSARRRHRQLAALLVGGIWHAAGSAASGDAQELEGAASVSTKGFEPLLDADGVAVVNIHVPYEGELPRRTCSRTTTRSPRRPSCRMLAVECSRSTA